MSSLYTSATLSPNGSIAGTPCTSATLPLSVQTATTSATLSPNGPTTRSLIFTYTLS